MSAYRQPEVAHAAREARLRDEVAELEARLQALSRRNSDEVGALVRRRFPWGRLAIWLLGFALGFSLTLPGALEWRRLSIVREGLFDLGPDSGFVVPGDIDTVAGLIRKALQERLPGLDWEISPDWYSFDTDRRWKRTRSVSARLKTAPPGEGTSCVRVLSLQAGAGLVAVYLRSWLAQSPHECPFELRNYVRYRTSGFRLDLNWE